uniref:Uncharacterized protein n=1 Tax=Paulinella longichromatophora TaxID=1708747 RepID=A0A2H4ZQM5_9EUKA|nr:hypothetical protein PLO_854 [Paulinella longichromatophora]
MDQSNPEPNLIPNERRSQGGRASGNREPGGFRIRLSDNEMKAARAVQEAFGLRSTVAALGFAIRTVGRMLEEGTLDDLVLQQRNQTQRTEIKAEHMQGQTIRRDITRIRIQSEHRPDPFARPSRPISNILTDASIDIVESITTKKVGNTVPASLINKSCIDDCETTFTEQASNPNF